LATPVDDDAFAIDEAGDEAAEDEPVMLALDEAVKKCCIFFCYF
jgi:hypothetical protein